MQTHPIPGDMYLMSSMHGSIQIHKEVPWHRKLSEDDYIHYFLNKDESNLIVYVFAVIKNKDFRFDDVCYVQLTDSIGWVSAAQIRKLRCLT
jgi:hypothetical protein